VSRSAVGLAIGLVTLSVATLHPAVASAGDDYGVVTIELEPEIGDVPTDVCVVSAAESPRARTGVQSAMLGDAIGPSADGVHGLSRSFWAHGAKQTACGEDGCAPQVRLPGGSGGAELWAACTSDSLLREGSQRARRLLVLMLDHLEGSPPQVEAVKLTGGIVTVGVRARLRDIVVTARSLGGHFQPQVRSVRGEMMGDSGKLVRLPIRPRCEWIDVAIPPGTPGPISAVQSHAGALDVTACVAEGRSDDRVRLLVPRAEAGGRVRVSTGPSEDTSVFSGEWRGAWPAEQLSLEAQQVQFSWRSPECVYPRDECPAAEVDGGVACASTLTEQGCHYRCPPGDDPSLSVSTPSAVTFTDGRTGQQWSEILQRSDQVLDGFVDRDRVDLVADVSQWERDVPGDRVTHLEVLGTDGSVRRYTVQGVDEVRVRAPDAGCEPLRYRVIGDRKHREGTAAVVDGEVEIPPPQSSARAVSFMIHVLQGGGPTLPFGGVPLEIVTPVYFAGMAQVIGALRPRKPKLARLSIELRVGGTVGQWGYFSPASIDAAEPGEKVQSRERTIWARFLVEPGLMTDVWGPLALGAGVGFGSSWPIRANDVGETSRFAFLVSPWIEGRVRLRSWLYLSGQARVVLGERLAIAVEDTEGRFRRTFFPAATVLGLYGLTFAF
jgi:hypothetical protein